MDDMETTITLAAKMLMEMEEVRDPDFVGGMG